MATNVQPTTIGQHLDAVLTAAGASAKTVEVKAETLAGKAWTWIKGEWHNVVTMVSVGYMALKAAGKL
jgi:hypothetical protein